LPEGDIYPKEERAVRDLLRKRSQLVCQQTAHLLSIQTLAARNTGRSWRGNRIKPLTYDEVETLIPDAHQALAITRNLVVLPCLATHIGKIEQVVKAQGKLQPAFKPLLTVSGIGDMLGLTMMLETGDIGRFARAGNLASSCRCVGSERLSNGKRTGRGNTKNGHTYLSWAFVEAANFAVRYTPQIKRYSQRKEAKTNRIVATKAVAHKLARACFSILRDQVPCDVTQAFG
jgi:transposase